LKKNTFFPLPSFSPKSKNVFLALHP